MFPSIKKTETKGKHFHPERGNKSIHPKRKTEGKCSHPETQRPQILQHTQLVSNGITAFILLIYIYYKIQIYTKETKTCCKSIAWQMHDHMARKMGIHNSPAHADYIFVSNFTPHFYFPTALV